MDELSVVADNFFQEFAGQTILESDFPKLLKKSESWKAFLANGRDLQPWVTQSDKQLGTRVQDYCRWDAAGKVLSDFLESETTANGRDAEPREMAMTIRRPKERLANLQRRHNKEIAKLNAEKAKRSAYNKTMRTHGERAREEALEFPEILALSKQLEELAQERMRLIFQESLLESDITAVFFKESPELLLAAGEIQTLTKEAEYWEHNFTDWTSQTYDRGNQWERELPFRLEMETVAAQRMMNARRKAERKAKKLAAKRAKATANPKSGVYKLAREQENVHTALESLEVKVDALEQEFEALHEAKVDELIRGMVELQEESHGIVALD